MLERVYSSASINNPTPFAGAVDSVDALHKRGRATEIVAIEVSGADGFTVKQKLEEVAGVARVVSRDSKSGNVAFEVEGLEGSFIRPDLARTIVHAGWHLTELRTVGESLEEIFLDLTRAEKTDAKTDSKKEAEGSAQ